MDQNIIRTLTQTERQILDKLFEIDFPGRDDLLNQAENCKVSVLDDDGSLKFHLDNSVVKTELVPERVPVEAEAEDKDGVMVQIILHVIDGKINELEFWKADGSRILGSFDPLKFKITVR